MTDQPRQPVEGERCPTCGETGPDVVERVGDYGGGPYEARCGDEWHDPQPPMSEREQAKRCPFCDYQGPSKVLYRGSNAYIIEPLNPVVPGHLIVVAYQHVDDFVENGHITGEVMNTASWWLRRDGYDESGDWNLITSKGSAATQTVPHLHVHLVPRRDGDGLQLPWDTSALQSQRKLTEEAEAERDKFREIAGRYNAGWEKRCDEAEARAESLLDEYREGLRRIRSYCPNQPTKHPADGAFTRIIEVVRSLLAPATQAPESNDG